MTKDDFRKILPDQLANKGLLTPANKSDYICPVCGNGSGDDGTGVQFNFINGGWLGHCFKCNNTFDIFHLIEHVFNLRDFKDQLAKANDLFDPKPDFKNYILTCHRNLNIIANPTYRAITFDTYNKFMCGFDKSTQRLIIPTSYNHYLARYTGDLDIPSPKKHQGSKEIFAFKRAKNFDTIFIVEGEFDALSLWQIDQPAISFSGSDISKHQQLLFQDFPKNKKFVILFDNDETGRLKSSKVATIIQTLGYATCIRCLPDNYNDCNDFLQANSDNFKATIDDILKNLSFDAPDPILFHDFKIPDNFSMDKSGITFIGKKPVFFSDVPATVTAVYHSNDYTDYKVELSIFNRQTNRYHSYKIDRADIADHKKLLVILAGYGVNINVDNSKLWSKFLGDFIATNIKIIPQVITVKYPGWYDNDFAYPNKPGKFLIDNGTDYKSMFKTKGDKNIWLNLFKQNFLSFPLMMTFGTVLAAPLIKVCGERHIQLALIAPSMRGKSALIKFAMSIFGDSNQLKNTFNSTNNSINDLGWRFNDLPCWIDEFQAANKAMKESVDQLIYAYENGKSRLRLNRVGNQREVHEFTGTRIFSAEQSILKHSVGQGAITRLIELTYSNVLDNDVAFNIHQTIKDNFGFFGYDWIKYIIDNSPKIISDYRKLHDDTFEHFNNYAHSHIQAFSLIATAFAHFSKHFTDIDFSYDDIIDYIKDNLFNILPTADNSTNAQRALTDLSEALTTRSKQFMTYNHASDTDATLAKYLDSVIQPTLGVILKNGDVGFFPRAVKKFLEDDCGYPDSKAIFRALNEIDALDSGNIKNAPFKKNIWLSNKNVQVFVVRKDFLNPDS